MYKRNRHHSQVLITMFPARRLVHPLRPPHRHLLSVSFQTSWRYNKASVSPGTLNWAFSWKAKYPVFWGSVGFFVFFFGKLLGKSVPLQSGMKSKDSYNIKCSFLFLFKALCFTCWKRQNIITLVYFIVLNWDGPISVVTPQIRHLAVFNVNHPMHSHPRSSDTNDLSCAVFL